MTTQRRRQADGRGSTGRQRGSFAVGLVVGLLAGLALALGVALYIAKVPVPFIDKVPQRTSAQDQQEAERNKTWNPNAPLAPATATAPPAPAASPGAASAPGRDPAAILSGGDVPAAVSTNPPAEAFTYFVQVGAYTRSADAETQRAAMAIQGLTARISERQQGGRVVYRVRLGPFERQAEADAVQAQLSGLGVDGQLVRVQRP